MLMQVNASYLNLKERKKNDLYLVIYKEDRTIEGITNDPDKWLENHNSDREADGESPEYEDDFEFNKQTPFIY